MIIWCLMLYVEFLHVFAYEAVLATIAILTY